MIILVYLLIGIFVGLLSGLLGLGGGVIVVPALAIIFELLHFPEAQIMHIAIGTSLASILITAIISTWSHNRRGAVLWRILKWFVPGMMAGSMVGVWIGKQLPTAGLKWTFAIFCLVLAIQMMRGKKTIVEEEQGHRSVSRYIYLMLAFSAGISSGVLGIGGGVVMIPMFLWIGLTMPQASACSAACVVPTALMGTLTAMMVGWHTADLPAQSIGFVYWPAALTIAVTSVFLAPVGVYLSHRLPVSVIKRIFGGILLIVACVIVPW